MELITCGRIPKKENLRLCVDIANVYEGRPLYNLSVYKISTKNHKYGSFDSEYTCVFDTDGYDLAELFKELRESRYSCAIDNLSEEIERSKTL